MPLSAPDPDEVIPKDLQALAENMRKSCLDGDGEWWTDTGTRTLPEDLPADLLDDPTASRDTTSLTAHNQQQLAREKGLIALALSMPIAFIGIMLGSLMISILIEWIGLYF